MPAWATLTPIAGFVVLAAVILFSTHAPDEARIIAPIGYPAADAGGAATQAVAAGGEAVSEAWMYRLSPP